MDLIDKIEDIQLNNYSKYTGSNEADLHTREDIVELTTKVAIDFANWIADNYHFNGRIGHWDSRKLDPRGVPINLIDTTEKLFQEFLKDYKYEN